MDNDEKSTTDLDVFNFLKDSHTLLSMALERLDTDTDTEIRDCVNSHVKRLLEEHLVKSRKVLNEVQKKKLL